MVSMRFVLGELASVMDIINFYYLLPPTPTHVTNTCPDNIVQETYAVIKDIHS